MIFLVSNSDLSSQIGVTLGYNLHQGADDWDANMESDEKVKADGIMLNLDYWFRLKNYRVEFLPEVGFVIGEQEVTHSINEAITTSYNQYHFFFNTSIYPLDFEGDCNCPTFGKDGSFFQKGFYLQLSPGITYLSAKTEYILSQNSYEDSALHLVIGIGAGLDIGLNDYITITPLLRYVLGFGATWNGLQFEGSDPITTESNTRDLQTGLRLTYRLDYKQSRF